MSINNKFQMFYFNYLIFMIDDSGMGVSNDNVIVLPGTVRLTCRPPLTPSCNYCHPLSFLKFFYFELHYLLGLVYLFDMFLFFFKIQYQLFCDFINRMTFLFHFLAALRNLAKLNVSPFEIQTNLRFACSAVEAVAPIHRSSPVPKASTLFPKKPQANEKQGQRPSGQVNLLPDFMAFWFDPMSNPFNAEVTFDHH
ncbi:hypothetical protein FF38_06850 [Lucilia cuprina]|uniref:Uncharacterized protein n=1 Tax=Lucilia cuprina TaxID=7375 RepID=A0A0L0CMS3_LUCCU|nr:hypothetical protein FF38_06850 [Lucilia cuprina]